MACVLTLCLFAAPAFAAPPASAPAVLSEQEKLIRDRMARLEDKMFELSQVLAKTDPKQSARLTDAFKESRQRIIRGQMDEIAALLKSGRLSDAGDKQKALTGDLEYLLKMLTEETSDFDAREREIQRLEELRKQLDKIIREQQNEKLRSEQAAKLQARLNQLRAATAKTAELVERQDKAALRGAGKATEPPAQGHEAAKQQAQIRSDARKLAENLKHPAEPSQSDKAGENQEQSPPQKNQPQPQGGAHQSGAQKSQEKQPQSGRQQSGDQQQDQQSGDQSTPGDSQPSKSDSNSQPQSKSEKSDSSAQDSKSPDSEQSAPSELDHAADQMEKAEAPLESGQRAKAIPQQEQAAQHLRRALQQLQKETSDLEKQMELDRQAREQKGTTDKTRQLADSAAGKQKGADQKGGPQQSGENGQQQNGKQQSGQQKDTQQKGGKQGAQQKSGRQGQQQDGQKDSQQGDQKGGKQGQQKSGQQSGQQQGDQQQDEQDDNNDSDKQQDQNQQPGQQGMEEAVPHQEQAERQLKEKNAKKATEQQQKALEKLEQAKEDLQDALEQLRKEQQEEMLTALETRFNAMLARQLDVNRVTTRLDSTGRAKWTRADQLDLASASENENWVSDSASQAAKILKDEGTTIVFPELVTGVHDDASTVFKRLTAADTGPAVRLIQNDIVETLKEMLDAVKKKKEENEKGGGGGGGGQDKKPLLPDSAELKMLRSCQLRVNHNTQSLEEQRAEPQTDMAQLDQDIARTARRQSDVARLARSMQEARAAEKEKEDSAP